MLARAQKSSEIKSTMFGQARSCKMATWFDVDLSRGLLHVRVSKNGKDRFVPINQTVRTMLERLPRTSDYVLPSPRTEGRLVDVKFRFDKAKKEAGIRDFRFHDLRHTAATRMADGGADAFALAEIFGWSDVRMALRYTHATDEAKRRAVENLAKPIGPSDESVTMKKAGSLPCPKSLILLVEQRGVEPLTSALRTRRSAKLSYCPTRSVILGSVFDECQAFATSAKASHKRNLRVGEPF